MSELKKYQDGLNQMQAAVKFLSSLSGVMAGLTAALPFSGQLFDFVSPKYFDEVKPGMVTTMSTLLSCYVIMYMVNLRDDIRSRPLRKIRRQSVTRLVLALFAFSLYIAFTSGSQYAEVFEQWWAMVFYATFIVSATYAFALVGMKEYLGDPMPTGVVSSVDEHK